MRPKLVKKPKKDSNVESNQKKINFEDLIFANVGGVKETVIHESFYEPVSKEYLKKIFPVGYFKD